MEPIASLLTVVDAYAKAECVSDKTVSGRVFKDSKKITALREGADITHRRMREALEWFSANWPENAIWPEGVERPATEGAVV